MKIFLKKKFYYLKIPFNGNFAKLEILLYIISVKYQLNGNFSLILIFLEKIPINGNFAKLQIWLNKI